MATASLHARHRRHPATEAGLWLVWITARITGLSTPLGLVGRWLAHLPWRAAASHAFTWCRRHGRAFATAASSRLHRVLIRAELAAADYLTGPAPELLDVATARLRRRTGWLVLGGGVVVNLLYLAIR